MPCANPLHHALHPALRPDYDHYLSLLRAALDEPTLNAAWKKGGLLNWKQAIAYALQESL